MIFSERLNDWIIERTKNIEFFIDNSMTNPMDKQETEADVYERLRNYYLDNKVIISSDNYCEDTIYGYPEINILFRVWHDQVHFENNFDFSLLGESLTAFEQIKELPEDWFYEKLLILAEVIGQAAYYLNTGKFTDQQDLYVLEAIGLNKKLTNELQRITG